MGDRRDRPGRRKLLGVAALLVVAAIVGIVIGGYSKAFTPVVRATVIAERSGLLMEKGAAVNMRGLKIGDVRDVRSHGDGAELDIAIEKAEAGHIPANVIATIGTPTLFGAKYVELKKPPNPSPAPIEDGAVIRTDRVVTEANTLLQSLDNLLTTVDVAKVNAALGGLAVGLQGNGDQLGQLVIQANHYLVGLNPSVPRLAQDLAVAAPVTDTYAAATPDLVRTLDNLRVTSGTLVEREPALHRVLRDVLTISGDAKHLLKDNGGKLDKLVSTLRPTASMLDHYSPMFPCLLASTNQIRRDLEHVMGYEYPGIHTFTSFLPSQEGYIYPRDLPKIGVDVGPTCFGAPIEPRHDVPFPHVVFDDGWLGFATSDAVAPGGAALSSPGMSPLVHRSRGPFDLGAAAPDLPRPDLPRPDLRAPSLPSDMPSGGMRPGTMRPGHVTGLDGGLGGLAGGGLPR